MTSALNLMAMSVSEVEGSLSSVVGWFVFVLAWTAIEALWLTGRVLFRKTDSQLTSDSSALARGVCAALLAMC